MQAGLRHWKIFILAIAVAVCADRVIKLFQSNRHASLGLIQTPSEFYSQHLDCDGLPIKAHRTVSYPALQIACGEIDRLLRHIPNVRSNLIAAGVEVHILGRKQILTELPEFRAFKGKLDGKYEFDQLRAISGLTVVCPEENLLGLPEDPYYARAMEPCVHEFAHAIQGEGVPKRLKDQIERRYKQALEDGLWRGAYAATNEWEFFAEMSTWYFGSQGFPPKGAIPSYGTDGLMLYDPKTFTLLDDLYEGRLEIGKFTYTSAKRVAPQPLGQSSNCTADGLLIFANQTASSFKLYLVGPEGQTAPWGDLVPYARMLVQSSVGCRWLLSDDRDQPVRILLPQSLYSFASVE